MQVQGVSARWRAVLAVVGVATLSGCAFLVLSGQGLKYARGGTQSILALDAAHFSARVTLTAPLELDEQATTVRLTHAWRGESGEVELRLVPSRRWDVPAVSGWFRDRPAATAWEFKLAADQAAELNAFKAAVARRNHPDAEGALEIGYGFSGFEDPTSLEGATLTVDVKLAEGEDYWPLLEVPLAAVLPESDADR